MALSPDALHGALMAAEKAGTKGAMADPSMMGGGGGGGATMQADPSGSATGAAGPGAAPATGDPSLDPTQSGGAPDPATQAVWAQFPGTDPTQMQALMQGGDLQGAMAQVIDAQAGDLDKMNAMHKAIMDALLGSMAMPNASQSTAGPAAGSPGIPGVGGEAIGYS